MGKSRKEIKDQMMAKQAFIKDEDIPQGWSMESADFINKVNYNADYYIVITKKTRTSLGF